MQMPVRGRNEGGAERPKFGQTGERARQGKPEKVTRDAMVEAGEELGLDAEQVNRVIQGSRHDQKARENRTERRRQE